MILTNCAACAAPLVHDAPRCVRCETMDIERALRVSQAKLDAREAEEAERLAALEAVARTAPPQPPPAMSRREQLFARPLTGRSRLDNMVAAGLVEEDDEDAWAADLEEELFS